MTLEKRSPLPVGRYWIDVATADKIGQFSTLIGAGEALGAVRLENVQIEGSSTTLDDVLRVLAGGTTPIAWFLFDVTGLGTFSIDAKTFGYPTVAGSDVHNQSDTTTEAEAESAVNRGFKVISAVLEGLAAVLAFKTIAELVQKAKRR
jgi:hypothetical protein